MTADLTKGLLRDLKKLHEFDEDYNVILKIGRGFDINSFNAHTVILKARSQYFKNVLKDLKKNKLFKKENVLTLEVPHISADAFKIVLKYIYTGTISLNDITNQESVFFMLDLIIAADELELYDLVDYLQDYIIENHSDWVKDNLIKIYQISYDIKNWDLNVFTKLRDRLSNLIQFIRFFTIPAANYIEDIRPYGMVLPEKLKEDVEKYYIMPNSKPPSHALPPRILPNKVTVDSTASEPKLWPDDFNDCDNNAKVPETDSQSSRDSLLSPSPDIDFDSVLINKNQIKLISRWIVGSHNLGIHGGINNINRFILLTRGNRDGMSGDGFHSRCDNKGPTIVLAKVDKTNVIVGGYNPNSWSSSNKWIATNQCFIFSFKSDGYREGIDDIILSRIKNPNVAIFDGDSNYDIGFSDLQLFSGKYEHKRNL
ncbi:8387_t:CDS:2 [Funneliformis geosporum]|nr:8387_t:CDS:2 [Funneliformis geosporum]